MAIIQYTPLRFSQNYVYPLSGQLLGAFLGLSSTIWVPLYFLLALIKAPGVKLAEVRTFMFDSACDRKKNPIETVVVRCT
jgi:hypothetical protein